MVESTVSLPVRFDFSYHAQFQESLQQLVGDASVGTIIFDFNRVEYIDSAALGMMMMWQKRAASSSKKVCIKGARGAAAQVLSMANMQRLFEYV
jgi:anti-anti-sigma factor